MNGWQAEAVTAPAVTPSCFLFFCFQYNTLFFPIFPIISAVIVKVFTIHREGFLLQPVK